jgi:hypothetical protein
MGTASSVNLFWAFVRYIMNNPYQSMETMTKKDFIRYVEEYAVANAAELAVGATAAGSYDDGLVTAATAYTDVQLPGVTGSDLDSAITLAAKETVFKNATYPGSQHNVTQHATATTYDNQKLYGL